jgi:hypothetical protein
MTDNQAETASPPGTEATAGETTAAAAAGESSRTGSPPVDDSVESPADANDGGAEARRPHYAPPQNETFDWRGWVLVGVVVVSFLVVPIAILFLPHARSLIESFGLTLRAAYLALPMIPAILLSATAVWAAVRARTAE